MCSFYVNRSFEVNPGRCRKVRAGVAVPGVCGLQPGWRASMMCHNASYAGSFLAMTDLTANELAERLGVTTRRARGLLRADEIAGRQLANGMWLADSDAVTRYELLVRKGSGPTLDVATAWGLLWELSGLDADWLSASTRARVRRRICDWDASAIASVVSKRSKAHRFTAANVERASAGLIRTGRAASGVLGPNKRKLARGVDS